MKLNINDNLSIDQHVRDHIDSTLDEISDHVKDNNTEITVIFDYEGNEQPQKKCSMVIVTDDHAFIAETRLSNSNMIFGYDQTLSKVMKRVRRYLKSKN